MPKLNSLEVVHQDTNKDSYENLHDIIVGLKGSQNQEVVDNEARALYESLLEMYVNDKEAFAKRIETLQAEFGDSLAKVVEEMLAYASQTEAYAKKITTVSAEVANANAMVQTEMFARATEDEALASQITTLSATVGSKNRTYYQSTAPTGSVSVPLVSGDLWIDSDNNKLYRYNGTSWEDIQDDQIGVNTAAISDEQFARTNADSALALDISAVTARLDTGDFSTVKTTSEASALKLLSRPNLVTDLSTWTLSGGLATATNAWGLTLTGTGSGTYTADSPYFEVTPNQTYTVSGDTSNTNVSGNVSFDIIFYNSSNVVVKDGANNPIYGAHTFKDDDTNRNVLAVSDTAPSTAVKAKARFVVTSGTGGTVGCRQVKVEHGGLPATPFSQEASISYASAKWGVTVDANGYAAGIALNASSTGTSEFVVAANKFRVKKPDGTDGIAWNGTNSRLDISGDVYANAFYGNVVGTGNINTDAVTQSLFSQINGQDQTFNFTISGSGTFNVYITGEWVQGFNGTEYLQLNGTTVRLESPRDGTLGIMSYKTTLSAGSHSARLFSSNPSNNGSNVIFVLVTKR